MSPALAVRASDRQGSPERDERCTPGDLLEFLVRRTFVPRLDVCATPGNTTVPENYFTIEDDGLSQAWDVDFWMNPPYSGIERWALKAVEQVDENRVRGLVLVPAAPETAWWQVLWGSAIEVGFLAPRVRFLKDGKLMGSPPFGSAVFMLGPCLVNAPPRCGLLRWKA